jgi:hypothetical protein
MNPDAAALGTSPEPVYYLERVSLTTFFLLIRGMNPHQRNTAAVDCGNLWSFCRKYRSDLGVGVLPISCWSNNTV